MAEKSQTWMRANVADGQQRGEAGEGIVTYTGPRRTTHAMDRSDRTWVYGRQGLECRRCGALVERRLQGTAARPTYWCPGCQPWVAAYGAECSGAGGEGCEGGAAEDWVLSAWAVCNCLRETRENAGIPRLRSERQFLFEKLS